MRFLVFLASIIALGLAAPVDVKDTADVDSAKVVSETVDDAVVPEDLERCRPGYIPCVRVCMALGVIGRQRLMIC